MGLDNPLHIAVLALVLVYVFRARRLPELAKALRAAMTGFGESLGDKSAPRSVIVQQGLGSAPTVESAPAVDDRASAYIIVGVVTAAPAPAQHVAPAEHVASAVGRPR
jgi:Sec-independent protein translocase protein TatA